MDDVKLAKWLENDFNKSSKSESDLDRAIHAIDSFKVTEVDADTLFNKIQQRISAPKPKRKTIRLKWVAGLAASIIGILFVATLYFSNTQIKTVSGQQLVHALPEQSNVFLNANSAISYSDDFETSREVTLKGEAFFDVRKGSTFSVKTDLGTVEVLGTSFNVIARNKTFVVACKTGKVKVGIKNDFKTIHPGDQVRLENGKLVLNKMDVHKINSWSSGESSFVSAPLSEVLGSLSQQYQISLPKMTPATLNQKFTGSFVHNDINKALNMVFLPVGINYELDSNGAIILH